MDLSFERVEGTTDEWYTPREILDCLGHFDMDPCAACYPLWKTADVEYTKFDDGLSREWKGRVWMNPPYSHPLIDRFMGRMAEHGNGIALTFSRCDSKFFHDTVFDGATALLFLRHRIKFFRPDGSRNGSPGCGSVLAAYGDDNAQVLKGCGLPGKYIRLKGTDLLNRESYERKERLCA